MLLGDSGAGKSSLSYACARAGWTYIADDASFLLNGGGERIIVGNCHQVRFRPTAAELFPEIEELAITPRAAGKPSIEMPMASMPHIVCAPTTHVDFLVFLNRRMGGPPELRSYRKDVAQSFMRQALFGFPRRSLRSMRPSIGCWRRMSLNSATPIWTGRPRVCKL